jgi:hypothetical protein
MTSSRSCASARSTAWQVRASHGLTGFERETELGVTGLDGTQIASIMLHLPPPPTSLGRARQWTTTHPVFTPLPSVSPIHLLADLQGLTESERKSELGMTGLNDSQIESIMLHLPPSPPRILPGRAASRPQLTLCSPPPRPPGVSHSYLRRPARPDRI